MTKPSERLQVIADKMAGDPAVLESVKVADKEFAQGRFVELKDIGKRVRQKQNTEPTE